MKKILLPIIGIVALLVLFYSCTFNKMVSMDEAVTASWAQVQNQYQRRLDLVPNLVATVKGYADHEEGVLSAVTKARASAGGVQVGADVLENPELFEKFQKAQDQLSGSLQRLLAVSESYPELKANENFLSLQDQLEGTENRIATERKRFNDAVQAYNSYIRRFPNSIIAGMTGFVRKQFFAASEEAQTAPKVEF
ncbi:MAG: LemA family protein [Treponemataceae bacterium]